MLTKKKYYNKKLILKEYEKIIKKKKKWFITKSQHHGKSLKKFSILGVLVVREAHIMFSTQDTKKQNQN